MLPRSLQVGVERSSRQAGLGEVSMIDEEGVGLQVNNLHHNLEASRFPSGRKGQSVSTASRTAESHRRKGNLVERSL